MAAALTRPAAEVRMAETKLKYNITTETSLGKCFQCHKAVDKYSFMCKKHSIELRKKHGWFGDTAKKNWAIKQAKLAPKALKVMRAKTLATRKAKEEEMLKAGAVLGPDTPVFYDDYKEPLTPVEGGYGFRGVVATDETRNFIQCHTCGNFYQKLAGHLKLHGSNTAGYKEDYGLSVKTALVGEAVREQRIKAREMRLAKGEDKGLPEHLKRYYAEVDKETLGRSLAKRGQNRWSLEQQNKLGLCPDQVLEKLTDLVKTLGRVPSQDEFKEHYHFRFMSSITTHFGSWTAYVAAAGLVTTQQALDEATTPKKLIHYLQEFYKKHQRVPMNSDFKRGIVVARYHYFKHFGTLNAARVEAGLPAVIPMPGHRYMLIKPEDFVEYEALRQQLISKRVRAHNSKARAFFDRQQLAPKDELVLE